MLMNRLLHLAVQQRDLAKKAEQPEEPPHRETVFTVGTAPWNTDEIYQQQSELKHEIHHDNE